MIYCQPCDCHGLNPIMFKKISIEEVVEASCMYFDMEPELLLRKSNRRELVEKRYMIMSYLSREMNMRLIDIAKFFGKDHTTVIHGKMLVDNLCHTDFIFNSRNEGLKQFLKQLN